MVTEMVFSGIYIRQTRIVWTKGSDSHVKRALTHIIYANGFLMILDTAAIIIEFWGPNGILIPFTVSCSFPSKLPRRLIIKI